MNTLELEFRPEQQPSVDDLMAMFDDGPILDDDIAFDEALSRAARDEADSVAFAAITQSFEKAKAAGDFAQIQQMAMVLGATACNHEHMQEFSAATTKNYLDDEYGHDHSHHETSQKKEEKDTKKSKKRTAAATAWLAKLFKRNW